jgi:hypothetical protein
MAQSSDESGSPVVQIHYIKTDGYREVPCHGVIGGPTPQGQLWLSLYSERPPIPRSVTLPGSHVPGQPNAVAVDEKTAVPVAVDARKGLVRTIEVTTYLDLDGAKRLQDWLQGQIQHLESVIQQTKPKP